jgi:hypothetical protein
MLLNSQFSSTHQLIVMTAGLAGGRRITMYLMGITLTNMGISHSLMGITFQKVLFQKCVSKGAFSKVRFSHSYAELRSGITLLVMRISNLRMGISASTHENHLSSHGNHRWSHANQSDTYANHLSTYGNHLCSFANHC